MKNKRFEVVWVLPSTKKKLKIDASKEGVKLYEYVEKISKDKKTKGKYDFF